MGREQSLHVDCYLEAFGYLCLISLKNETTHIHHLKSNILELTNLHWKHACAFWNGLDSDPGSLNFVDDKVNEEKKSNEE